MAGSKPRLPAEWESQAGVMLTWPHAATDWAADLDRVRPVFAAIGAAISQREYLLSIVPTGDERVVVEQALASAGADMGRCRFAIVPSDDTWARDHGPIGTIADGCVVLNDFRFNAWGGKYDARLDNAISARLLAGGVFAGGDLFSRDMVLEGGAIETDGRGTLLATRRSVIDPARNPALSVGDVERLLGDWLGIERFLWLDHGALAGDDTDSHVDTLVRFADAETLLYVTAPADDADHPALAAMAGQLETFRSAAGRPYRLLPLPFPGVHRAADGRRLPASYANFLVINDAVLMPAYGVNNDAAAAAVLAKAFPGRDVITIDCRTIIEQNGSLHCLTMQFPSGLVLSNSAHIDSTDHNLSETRR
jgi:agmatine/peptidylarginine deiminase